MEIVLPNFVLERDPHLNRSITAASSCLEDGYGL